MKGIKSVERLFKALEKWEGTPENPVEVLVYPKAVPDIKAAGFTWPRPAPPEPAPGTTVYDVITFMVGPVPARGVPVHLTAPPDGSTVPDDMLFQLRQNAPGTEDTTYQNIRTEQ